MSYNHRVSITSTASYTLDDQIQVYGNNTYTYDDDGYLIQKATLNGVYNYTYGSLGELRSVTTPTANIEYLYNANNQRVAKKVNGTIVEKYLWSDLTTLLAIYDKDDNLIQRFEYSDGRMPTSMTQNNTKYYLHYDQVGSLRAISDTSGNIIKEITYDTYGNILSDTNANLKVPFGFAGGLLDKDTGLTRFGYRDYDSYTGKWTAKDPIDFSGGDTNLYGYVLGDPVNFVDPRGEFPWLIIPLFFFIGDTWLNAPALDQAPETGMTPAQEVAGMCLGGGGVNAVRPKSGFFHGPHHNFGTKKNPAWRSHFQLQWNKAFGNNMSPTRIPYGTRYPLKYGK